MKYLLENAYKQFDADKDDLFVFIDVGNTLEYYHQILYSIATMEIFSENRVNRIRIHTDKPKLYEKMQVEAVDISSDIVKATRDYSYIYRLKPYILLKELERFGSSRNVVMLDSDTYFLGDFANVTASIKCGVVIMDAFESINPYPWMEKHIFSPIELSNGSLYRYDKKSLMYNSGIIGASQTTIPAIKDALKILDSLIDQNAHQISHTLEQFCLTESFRINNIYINEARNNIIHYYKKTDKKFMNDKIKEIAATLKTGEAFPRTRIKHNWILARLHKIGLA